MRGIVVNYPGLGDWVAKQTGGEFSGLGATFGYVRNGELQAGILYDNYNGANIHVAVAAVPGGKWMTKEFLRVAFDYPFRQLNVRRITALIAESNAPSIRFTEHMGFTREATLVDAHPTGNLLIYAMRKEDCRWLNIKEAKHGQE